MPYNRAVSVHAFILSTCEAEEADLCEFESRLAYKRQLVKWSLKGKMPANEYSCCLCPGMYPLVLLSLICKQVYRDKEK